MSNKKGLVSKARARVATSIIIDNIFDLSDRMYRDSKKIDECMHELKSRGSEAIYEYYVKYVKRVLNDEVKFENINVYYALNEVLKLNEAEKIWNFVNLLQELQMENKFSFNMDKCSKAMAKTNNVKFNLFWAEVYPEHNADNIEFILRSRDAMAIARMVALVDNLTEEQIAEATKIVKASKNKEAKKELKNILIDKNYDL